MNRGYESIFTPFQICCSPLTVTSAAWIWPMRILRIMSDSSPAAPAGYTCTVTEPSEMRAHSAESLRSAVSHGEPFGAMLPSLRVSASEGTALTTRIAAMMTDAQDVFFIASPR